MTETAKLKRLFDLQDRLDLARATQREGRRLTTRRIRRLIQLEDGLSRVNRLADGYALQLLNAQRAEEAAEESDWDWLDTKLNDDDGRQFAVLIP